MLLQVGFEYLGDSVVETRREPSPEIAEQLVRRATGLPVNQFNQYLALRIGHLFENRGVFHHDFLLHRGDEFLPFARRFYLVELRFQRPHILSRLDGIGIDLLDVPDKTFVLFHVFRRGEYIERVYRHTDDGVALFDFETVVPPAAETVGMLCLQRFPCSQHGKYKCKYVFRSHRKALSLQR